jgi:polysaccharide transporter, PST family
MILAKIRKFIATDLFKTSFWNGIATAFKLLTGIITNKIVAVYLGPSGIALLGQFNNFTTMVQSFATMGVTTGITKYVAEYNDDEEKRNRILSTAFYLLLIGSVVASFVIYFGRFYFSDTILHNRKYVPIFVVLAATMFLFTFNSYFISIFNGFKQFRVIILRNILGALISLTLAILLVIKFGLFGALIGVILSQTLIFFVLVGAVSKSPWFTFAALCKFFDIRSILKLSNYTLMTFVTAIFVTYIQLRIRNHIIKTVSLTDAGYWEAIVKISNVYLTVITTTLSLYYLPRLSEIKIKSELRAEIISGYKFLLPLTLLIAVSIFILKKTIILVLYSPSFLPILPLFAFQLTGDALKISSWLLAYNMHAKAMTFTFVATEIVFGLFYYFLTVFFVHRFGIIGTTYAYGLNYFIYLCTMIIIFMSIIKKDKND